MYLRILTLAALTVSLLGSTASAQLSNYSEDFESLDRTDGAALSNQLPESQTVAGSSFSQDSRWPTTLATLSTR